MPGTRPDLSDAGLLTTPVAQLLALQLSPREPVLCQSVAENRTSGCSYSHASAGALQKFCTSIHATALQQFTLTACM